MVVGNLQTHKSMVTHDTSTFAFFLQAALGQGWMQARTKKCEKRANTISREALLPRPQIKTATVRNRAAAVVSGFVCARSPGTRMDSAPSWEEQRSLMARQYTAQQQTRAAPHARPCPARGGARHELRASLNACWLLESTSAGYFLPNISKIISQPC